MPLRLNNYDLTSIRTFTPEYPNGIDWKEAYIFDGTVFRKVFSGDRLKRLFVSNDDSGILYYSEDFGLTWTQCFSPGSGMFCGVWYDPRDKYYYAYKNYAGIYRAHEDSLSSWSLYKSNTTYCYMCVSANDGSVLIRRGAGIYRSTDNGTTETLVCSIGVSYYFIYNETFGYILHDGSYRFRISKDGISWLSKDLLSPGAHDISTYRDISDTHPDYIVIGSNGNGSYSSYIRLPKVWNYADGFPTHQYFESVTSNFNYSYYLDYFMYRRHYTTMDIMSTKETTAVAYLNSTGTLNNLNYSNSWTSKRPQWAIRDEETGNYIMSCYHDYTNRGMYYGKPESSTKTLALAYPLYRAYC